MSWWDVFVKKSSGGPSNVKEAPVPLFDRMQAGRAVYTDWNSERAVTDGLKVSTWVYAANRFIASKISPIPWVVERLIDSENDEWEEVTDHPAKTLIDNPNPIMSGQDLRERWIYNLGLAGNGLGVMTMARRAPVEIWPLMPHTIKPVPNADGTLSFYEYRVSGGRKIHIEPAEVIHHMYIDPSNFYWGMSPLQAMARVVDTDVAAVNWNAASLANRAKKDYAFFPEEPLSKAQWEEARDQLRAQHSGPSNAGGWFLGAMPGKLEELGMSPSEMDYLGSRVQNREEILAGYGLPEILLTGKGILRNYETAVKQFWEDLAIPLLDDFAEEFNRSIMPWFDVNSQPKARLSGAKPQLRFRYDVSGVPALQENLSEKIAQVQQLTALGVPLNIAINFVGLGLEPIEGGDLPRVEPLRIAASNPGPDSSKDLDWDMEWKRLDLQRTKWEQRVEQLLIEQFRVESERVERAFINGGLSWVELEIEDGRGDWEELFIVFYREIIRFFGEQEAQRLERETASGDGPESRKEIVFNPFAQFITTFITDQTARKVREIADSSKAALASLIGTGLDANQPTDEIARSIRNQYSDWATPTDSAVGTHRAFVISRTEVGAAQNWAQMEGARQARNELGVNIQKRWLSSRDSRVRESHSLIDGETRPLEEPFSNGLMHPGDPFGPAAEVIQCRCVASNVITRR